MPSEKSGPKRSEDRARLAPRRPRRKALVASPHDVFFRAIFSRPDEATGLLRAILPAPLAEGLDASSVTVASPAHVDGALRASQSDLVLSARLFGTAMKFVAILEHRSTVEHRMALGVIQTGWVPG
jgi:predicted transposase YdaD